MDAAATPEPVDGVMGRWFEELPVQLVVRHALAQTVTEADNTLFCALTHNPQPLHLDATFAVTTEFGECLVNSLFTLNLVVGMSVGDTMLGTTVANLGFEESAFPARCCSATRQGPRPRWWPSGRPVHGPDAGIVTFEHRAHNQRDELVCRTRRNAPMRRRP